jgi:lipopolysaccharide/colanic/teichoic acid biosynthesis glycosyltransferase
MWEGSAISMPSPEIIQDVQTSQRAIQSDGVVANNLKESLKAEDKKDTHREVKVHGGKFYEFVKRFFDIVASGTFLLLFGWLILILMLIKWLEDLGGKSYKLEIVEDENGSYISKNGKKYSCKVSKDSRGEKDPTVHGAIYSSERVGKGGKIFKLHKIRSMCPGAEKMKYQLLELGINEADAPAFKLKDDPRITKFGKFLRKTSLDELPQIWDIFVGRLSIVGPRSPLPIETSLYNEYQMHRLDVKGGLLCLWQITPNRNKLSFDEWVDLDVKYIEKRSVAVDLKIIFKGLWFVLTDHSGE